MTTKTASTIRLDPQLREALAEGLAEVGLTVNSYFTMAAKQFVIQGKVPFEIQRSSKAEQVRFNEQTRKIIARAHAEEEGILPNTAETFDKTDEAMKALFDNEK